MEDLLDDTSITMLEDSSVNFDKKLALDYIWRNKSLDTGVQLEADKYFKGDANLTSMNVLEAVVNSLERRNNPFLENTNGLSERVSCLHRIRGSLSPVLSNPLQDFFI